MKSVQNSKNSVQNSRIKVSIISTVLFRMQDYKCIPNVLFREPKKFRLVENNGKLVENESKEFFEIVPNSPIAIKI